MNAVYTIQLTRAEYLFTEITVHKSGPGGGRTVFGGDGMWQWGFGGEACDPTVDHIRAHGKAICWAEWLHNGLDGMHTTILHAEGGPFCIHDKHSDYAFMEKLWDLAQMTESEVLSLPVEELKIESL